MTESQAEAPAHSRGALLGCSDEAPILRPAPLLLPICWYTKPPKTDGKEASPPPTPYLTRSYQNSAFPSHCWETGKCWTPGIVPVGSELKPAGGHCVPPREMTKASLEDRNSDLQAHIGLGLDLADAQGTLPAVL
ncbi:hypothetical protein MJG53_011418 [Ovis ammon polii x Ovis aries]|uniref:Uncharacterized protein n=2 Tax=Ovis TaxID=9935 RepID=A0A835ZW02_SHEEP|nr:hypothetical protein JEQ12_004028 [Ovis aries]KAI4578563.1 hypothetical protein MJG53_011418 [Ovis ammon polii x Ovis aries]